MQTNALQSSCLQMPISTTMAMTGYVAEAMRSRNNPVPLLSCLRMLTWIPRDQAGTATNPIEDPVINASGSF
jgi:hypothetical protein